MAENQTNKERLDVVNVKLDSIISSLQEKTGVVQLGTVRDLIAKRRGNANYLFYYYGESSVDDLLTYNDTADITSMSYMFANSSVITIPLINTSKVTNMDYMFFYSSVQSIPLIDTSNVTNMKAMFLYSRITTIPALNTSKVISMEAMFRGSGLMSMPVIDTSKVTTMSEMFRDSKMTTIPALNVSNVTNFNYIFGFGYQQLKLTEIHMYGMKSSFDISGSTLYTRDALVEILNNLATVTSSRTLAMGSTNLAKLTEDDIAIATTKGWTLS